MDMVWLLPPRSDMAGGSGKHHTCLQDKVTVREMWVRPDPSKDTALEKKGLEQNPDILCVKAKLFRYTSVEGNLDMRSM